MRPLRIISLIIMLLAALGCVRNVTPVQVQGEAPWLDGRWPHEKSTLPRSNQSVFGRLENGMRYVIKQNEKPEDRVTVQLNIQAGSMMERDNELGLAHFLEHMAFNGSRNFAPGELIPFFQENGLAFGRDANAHTSLMETVYKLNLASDEANLNKGLLFMRDVADGLSILPEEVEKERGVILSEKAARDSEQYRAGQRRRQQLFAGTRFVNDVIGTEEVIRTASAETLRGFYDAWYRPELMVLVVVGNIDPVTVEKDIKTLFGDFKAHGERRVLESWGDVQYSGVQTYQDTYDTEYTIVTMGAMKPREWLDDSPDLQRRMLHGAMANSIINKRMQRLQAKGDAPFLKAFARESATMYLFPSVDFITISEAGNWQKSFAIMQDELRRTLEFGFLPEEVAELSTELLRSYEKRAKFEAQIPSDSVAETMISCFNGNRVYQSWQQTYDMYKVFIEEASAEDLHRAFVEMWDSGNRIISVTGNAVIEGDADAVIRNLWEEGNSRTVVPVMAAGKLDYPYVAEPKTAGVVARKTEKPVAGANLTLHEVVFESGLVLRMIPTTFLKDRSSLSLHIGGGGDSLPDNSYITATLAMLTDSESGFGKLTAEEASRLQRSTGYGTGFSLQSKSLMLGSGGETEDMQGILQAMWTQFRDPFIEEKDRQEMLRGLAIADAARNKDVPSAMSTAGRELFFGKSLRIDPITAGKGSTVSLADMQTALKSLYVPVDGVLNIVGDFDPAKAQALVAATFGSSEVQWKPLSGADYAYVPKFAQKGKRERHIVVDADLNQAALRVGYLRRLEDIRDRKTLTARRLLASVARDRLRESVREELGASYSPSFFYWVDSDNGYGMYMVNIGTQPDKLEKLVDVVNEVMADIAANGVTEEEVERQRKPMLSSWEEGRRENAIYMGMLDTIARTDWPSFEWNAQFPELLNAVTVEELNREARAAFTDANKAVLTGTESGKKAKQAAKAAAE
ncbi:M16 family metallopeptidase [Oleidesulfovibrio sp.]|uniref:M16 family metallopeptidase n=1 Tax=Oleidesulfovibrio sp. TaxID=2909707 RepID=UPI003A88DF3A